MTTEPPVWSCNEWDPLREVIVGTARGAADVAYEPALSPYFGAALPHDAERAAPVMPELVGEAERQLDAFAAVLEERGIVVRRPEADNRSTPFSTPDWSVPMGRATACPRDVLLVVGDEIIEAPMAQRSRWFEYRAYRSLVIDYFRRGARWTAAPKPAMDDALYHARAHDRCAPFDFARDPLLTETEPAFDAASFTRFGRDIFWQPDLVSNRLGAQWLQRHLGDGFRVHEVRFGEPLPAHIDTTLVPIRPGLVLVNPHRPCVDGSLALFERNGWNVVPAPLSVRSGAASRDVSSWISMNILMLDERTAVVEASERPMIELLESLGCEVVPVPFDRVYAFGGGPHCCTADIRRDGSLQSYFPSLD